MKSKFKSPRSSSTNRSWSTSCNPKRKGSATHNRTKKNSKGPWTTEVTNKRLTMAGPLSSSTSIRVAPRLKNPTRLPVSNEKAVSRRFAVALRRGGSQRTLPITQGYTKERATGTQLLKKISNVTAIPPRAVAARTGATTRELIKSSRKPRNVNEYAVSAAPAKEPRPKATRVAPNAISMNFMASISAFVLFHWGV